MAFQIYFDLRASGKFDDYAGSMLRTIVRGKPYAKEDIEYKDLLVKFFQEERYEYRLKGSEEHVDDVQFALGLEKEDDE